MSNCAVCHEPVVSGLVVHSVCREDFCTIIHETERFKYCPNCGARMDGERRDGDDL